MILFVVVYIIVISEQSDGCCFASVCLERDDFINFINLVLVLADEVCKSLTYCGYLYMTLRCYLYIFSSWQSSVIGEYGAFD